MVLTTSQCFSHFGSITFETTDELVFYTTASRLDTAAEKAIQSFVEQGGGLVALHGASGSFTNSKTWFQLVGGRFAGHAPGTYQLVINLVDVRHPITQGVEPFTITDEEYTYQFTDGAKRQVLAQFRERPDKTVEKNGNNDILWTLEVGKGRVFQCGLGHDVKAWSNPSFQKLVSRAFTGRPAGQRQSCCRTERGRRGNDGRSCEPVVDAGSL